MYAAQADLPFCWLSLGSSEIAGCFPATEPSALFKQRRISKFAQSSSFFSSFGRCKAFCGNHILHYTRTSPAVANKYRRALHRFDRANNATLCAVFLVRPPKAHFFIAKLAFDDPKRMLDLGANQGLGLLDFADRLVQNTAFSVLFVSAAASSNRMVVSSGIRSRLRAEN